MAIAPAVKNIYGATAGCGCRRVLPTPPLRNIMLSPCWILTCWAGWTGLQCSNTMSMGQHRQLSTFRALELWDPKKLYLWNVFIHQLLHWWLDPTPFRMNFGQCDVFLASLIHTHIQWACCSDSTGGKETLQLEQIVRLPGESANANSLSI